MVVWLISHSSTGLNQWSFKRVRCLDWRSSRVGPSKGDRSKHQKIDFWFWSHFHTKTAQQKDLHLCEGTHSEGTHNYVRFGVLQPILTGLEWQFIPVTDLLESLTEEMVEQRLCHFCPTNPCLRPLFPQLTHWASFQTEALDNLVYECSIHQIPPAGQERFPQ